MTIGSGSPAAQRHFAAVLLVPIAVTFVALLFWRTTVEMVDIWLRTGTFTHAFLVPPIVAWLVWRRRHALSAVSIKPQPWVLVPLALLVLLWLLGEAVEVGAASQFALVAIWVALVPALCGWALTRELAFPLAFCFFMVPVGDFIVPRLMDWTADFTVTALEASGVPVYREGLQFVIPSGNWSVVEACSGVRYLIASFMVGTLYAYLNYRSMKRRLAFLVVALAVPLVANWLRAYMIVMLGHLSNNQLAVGVDHLIYGWVFFGVVIGLMFFIGSRWAEPEDEPIVAAANGVRPMNAATGAAWATFAGVVLLAGAGAAWQRALDAVDDRDVVPPIALPTTVQAWSRADDPMPWVPGFLPAASDASGAFRQGDRMAWLWLGHYRHQDGRSKAVSSVNFVVPVVGSWQLAKQASRPPAQGLPGFEESSIREGSPLVITAPRRLRVWRIYRVAGRWTPSGVEVKLRQAVEQLLGRGDAVTVMLLAVPEGERAEQDLEEFARAALPAVADTLHASGHTR